MHDHLRSSVYAKWPPYAVETTLLYDRTKNPPRDVGCPCEKHVFPLSFPRHRLATRTHIAKTRYSAPI